MKKNKKKNIKKNVKQVRGAEYFFIFGVSFVFFLFLFFAFSNVNLNAFVISGYGETGNSGYGSGYGSSSGYGYGNCPDQDGDGYSTCNGDCNDADTSIYPTKTEICFDGKDNNCNGIMDCSENSCAGMPGAKTVSGIIDTNQLCCNRNLVNIAVSQNNCGACGISCSASQSCVAGICVNPNVIEEEEVIQPDEPAEEGLTVESNPIINTPIRNSLNDFFRKNFGNPESGSVLYVSIDLENGERIILPIEIY